MKRKTTFRAANGYLRPPQETHRNDPHLTITNPNSRVYDVQVVIMNHRLCNYISTTFTYVGKVTSAVANRF